MTPTLPHISDTAKWYCVLVKPGWLARVEGDLYRLGYRSFTPKIRKWVSHARKKSVAERPVLSRYLFVSVDYPKQSYGEVRSLRGVAAILSSINGPVAYTAEGVADFIRRQLTGEWDDIAKGKIPVGAKVKIMEGPNADKEAVITSVKGNKVGYKLAGTAESRTDYAMNVRAA